MLVVDLFIGEQSGFDPLCELDLLLGVQQRHFADLLQVILHRVGGGTGRHDLLLRLISVVGLRQREALILGKLFLELCLFCRLEGRLIDVVQAALLADCEDDLLTLQVNHYVSGERIRIKIDIELLEGNFVELGIRNGIGIVGVGFYDHEALLSAISPRGSQVLPRWPAPPLRPSSPWDRRPTSTAPSWLALSWPEFFALAGPF